MELISDVVTNKVLIDRILKKYASSAEHNYYCFLYNIEPWEEGYIFSVGDDKGILLKYDADSKEWNIFSEILAPEDERIGILVSFLDYAFTKHPLSSSLKKVWCEFGSKTRKELLKYLKNNPYYKVNKICYTLEWPLFDLTVWNGEQMNGKEWKDMRYYWNKYFREHKVEFKTVNQVSKEELKQLVLDWKKQRTTGDRTFYQYYIHAIEHDFFGYDNHRIMVVDGRAVAITAGYNVFDGYYYSSIGVYTRDIDRTGEISNMDDLMQLKQKNYKLVDFGGGEKSLTAFKSKFRPTNSYKTHMFSIVRKK